MSLKFLGIDGLKALSGYLKQAMETADGLSSAVSNLGDDIKRLTSQLADTLREIENCLTQLDSTKADLAVRQEFTLSAGNWAEDNTVHGYPHRYVLPALEVTSNARADAVISAYSMKTADTCGLCPSIEIVDGAIIFRARRVPAADISGQIYMILGVSDIEQKEEE